MEISKIRESEVIFDTGIVFKVEGEYFSVRNSWLYVGNFTGDSYQLHNAKVDEVFMTCEIANPTMRINKKDFDMAVKEGAILKVFKAL